MKDFIQRFKKDLNRLQTTLQKEGDDLIKNFTTKVKTAASNEKLQAKRKEIEKLLEARIKKFEPALETFLRGVKTNAEKAGIDVTKIEAKLTSAAKAARTRLQKAQGARKKTGSRAKSKTPRKSSSKTQSESSSN